MKTDSRICIDDATAPQPVDGQSFQWRGFCKTDIIGRYAVILAHAVDNQWARAEKKSRPGNTSRRKSWRNSSLCQRFWCPSSRQPVHVKPRHPNPPSSPSRPRSMSSRPRPKANTTTDWSGQGNGSAPIPALRPCIMAPVARFLWSRPAGCISVTPCCRPSLCASVPAGQGACLTASPFFDDRRTSCPDLRLHWFSGRLSQLRLVRGLHLRLPPPWPNPSWLRQPPARASGTDLNPDQAIAPDPLSATYAPRHKRGHTC